MKTVRHALCAFAVIASLLAPSAVRATSYSSDQSDIWYVVGEDGWAIQIVQRGSTIFATMYVYGPTGAPTWYVATMDPTGTSFQWSGDLYTSTGPWFGTVPYNPANFIPTLVGTMTWQSTDVADGTLSYVVNGVTVVKNTTRYTLVLDDFSGHYAGGEHLEVTSCINPAFNGTTEMPGLAYITQNGQTITIQTISAAGTCSYSGTLSEAGQMGSVQGSFSCSDGSAGSFAIGEMQVNIYGITASLSASNSNPPGCQTTGWFGGVFGTTF